MPIYKGYCKNCNQKFEVFVRSFHDRPEKIYCPECQNPGEKSKILIVSGYHPNETFALRVGEDFCQKNSNPNVQAVEYTGKPDRKTSTYNLRQFIENFDPVISPIILHDDDELEFDAAIVYCAKSKMERKRALRPLLDFASKYQGLIATGRFLTCNIKCTLIDLELNPKMGLEKARELLESFSEYLIDLYLTKGIKL